MAVVDAALRVERTAPLPPPVEPAPGPEQIPLTEHGNPPVPSQPAEPSAPAGQGSDTDSGRVPAGGSAWTARRVIGAGSSGLEALLAAELAAVQREIEEFRAEHPDTPVEIIVRPVDGTDQGGAGVSGTETEGHR
jgi:hypothetical protein